MFSPQQKLIQILLPLFAFTILSGFSIGSAFFNPDVSTRNQPPQRISDILNPIIQNVYIIGGLLSLVGFIYAGTLYLLGASQGDPNKMSAANSALIWSIAGLAILFAVYWVIEIIQFITGSNILNPPV